MAAGEKTPLTRDVELGGGGKAAVRTRLRIDNACCEAEATLAKKTLHAALRVGLPHQNREYSRATRSQYASRPDPLPI